MGGVCRMDTPQPAIMPEDTVPAAHETCRQCELSGHGTRVIWGEGNPAAPLFVVLDNPGAREDQDGTPFLCGTRETLQRTAFAAGIKPGAMYVSYVLKCRPRKAYDRETARSVCIDYLWGQLEVVRPALVMCLGNVVCRAFFGDPEAEVKCLRGRVHSVRGYQTAISYHPLAVRRRPALYKYALEDWRLAAGELKRLLAAGFTEHR